MQKFIKVSPPYKLKTYILLNDFRTAFGLILLLIGQIISLNDISFFDTIALKISFSETREKQGTIIEINPIYYTLFNHNIYGYDYEINDSELGYLYGASYGKINNVKVGDKIRVEYLKNDPSVHRIKGLKNSFFIDITVIYWLVSIIALIFIAYGVRYTWLFLRLIKEGYITTAKLYERPKSSLIGETRYYKLKFLFETKKGEEILVIKELSNAENILDDEEELIVYSQENPYNYYFIDRLPQKLKDYIYNEIIKQK